MVKQNKIHFRQRVQHKRMTMKLFDAVQRMHTAGYSAAKISEEPPVIIFGTPGQEPAETKEEQQ